VRDERNARRDVERRGSPVHTQQSDRGSKVIGSVERARHRMRRGADARVLRHSCGYDVEVSIADEDATWDAFVAAAPGGHHVQTSLWGKLKASEDWWPVRLLVRRDRDLVAGVQVLMRSLPWVGAIAYAPKGPVARSASPELSQVLLDGLDHVASVYRIRHLTVQPANDGHAFAGRLREAGYRPSDAAVAPVATVQIDVRREPATILAGMRKNHRRYVRHGLRQGVEGRVGTDEDLEAFYRLVIATSRRHGFEPHPFGHFVELWRLFRPRGLVQLFVSEYRGQMVSGQLAIAFGDRVIAKNSGWNGEHGSLGPNHVMEWTTLQWARDNGYHYYDLEGIDVRAARIALAGESQPDQLRRKHSFYKLGFGGEVVMFPGAHVRVPNPVLRWGYWTVFPRLAPKRAVRSAINRLRTR
jgi:lipid II:glycine glycyltransferase (peptidoglycan interpeptide bridge formation enzyme)